jgi:hypothetical protein
VQASVLICDVTVSDHIEVIVRALGFIEFVSAVEDGDLITVTFVVKDEEGYPWPDAQVEFSHSAGPGVTLAPLTDLTDGSGEVQTILDKGTVTTPVVVTATAILGVETVSANSPPL